MYNTIIKLNETIMDCYRKIKVIQDNCKHINVTKVNKASTGNYDPYADRYWRECHCPDCGKRWSEDQ